MAHQPAPSHHCVQHGREFRYEVRAAVIKLHGTKYFVWYFVRPWVGLLMLFPTWQLRPLRVAAQWGCAQGCLIRAVFIGHWRLQLTNGAPPAYQAASQSQTTNGCLEMFA